MAGASNLMGATSSWSCPSVHDRPKQVEVASLMRRSEEDYGSNRRAGHTDNWRLASAAHAASLTWVCIICVGSVRYEEASEEGRKRRRREYSCGSGVPRLSQAGQGKIARAKPADLRYREGHRGRRGPGRDPQVGSAELPDTGDEKRHHDP